MKKTILASFFFLALFSREKINAQVPNGGFENWTSTSYMDPTGWFTGNRKTIGRMGIIPVNRVTGSAGSYAVRIQTTIIGPDTSESYFSNSIGDPIKGEGGVPFTDQPNHLSGSYRYNIVANDTALILVIFKKNGAIISLNIYKLTGSQNTFGFFAISLTLPMAPDTLIFAAASSNLIANTGVQSGSFLELDGLTFGTPTPIPNGGFENWNSLSYDAPNGWQISGDSVSKTTDHFAGSYAIRMKTQDYGGGDINSAYITTGQNSHNGTTGGLPYTSMVDTLTGYYKYITSGSDTANGSVQVSHLGTTVGGYGFDLPPAASYTYFQVPIIAGSTPDTMRIDFSSSKWPYTFASVGSTLYLDRLFLKSVLVNVPTSSSASSNTISSYPNPATEVLNIGFKKNPTADFEIRIYTVTGILMKTKQFASNATDYQLDIGDLAAGTYYYEAVSKEGRLRSMFLKD